jgi:hypothetical protein
MVRPLLYYPMLCLVCDSVSGYPNHTAVRSVQLLASGKDYPETFNKKEKQK